MSLDTMTNTLLNAVGQYGNTNRDSFMSNISRQLHPDPFGVADHTQQKLLSGETLHYFGMYLKDESRSSNGLRLYQFNSIAKYTWRHTRRVNFAATFFAQSHAQREYSVFMDEDYAHSSEAAVRFVGDPLDHDVV